MSFILKYLYLDNILVYKFHLIFRVIINKNISEILNKITITVIVVVSI